MSIEEKIIKENLITKEHIDEIYILFVMICDNKRYSITPLNFINVFTNIAEMKNLNIEKKVWDEIFMVIDSDKDGLITFPDFIKFIYNHFKIYLNNTNKQSSEQMNTLISYKERTNFHYIINCIFFESLIRNKFSLIETTISIQNIFVETIFKSMSYTDEKNEEVLLTADKKYYDFQESIAKLQNPDFLMNLFSLITSDNIINVSNGIIILNNTLNSFDYLTTLYEISSFIYDLNLVYKSLMDFQIFEKVLLLFNIETNDSNLVSLQLYIIEILKKLVKCFSFLINFISFSRENFDNSYSSEFIKSFENLYSSLINHVNNSLVKVNYYLNIGVYGAYDSVKLSINYLIEIVKLSKQNFDYVFRENGFDLIKIIKINIDTILKNNNVGSIEINEIKKYIIQCCKIAEFVGTYKDADYTTISTIFKKIHDITNSIKVYFLNYNNISFQCYYIMLLGFISIKKSAADSEIIKKTQELILIYGNDVLVNYTLINSFLFYLKILLTSKFNNDSILTIVETKTFEFIENIIDINKNSDEVYLAKYLDLLDICITEHKNQIILSNLKPVIMFLEKIIRYYSKRARNKAVKLITSITNINERLIDILIIDSEVLNLVMQKLFEIEDKESYFIELYCVNKPFYYIYMIHDSVQLITNILHNGKFSNDFNYLRYFTVKNIDILSDLAKSLLRIWDKQTDSPESNDDKDIDREQDDTILLFGKYQDLPGRNVLEMLLDLLRNLRERYQLLRRQDTKKYEYQTDIIISCLDKSINELEPKYAKLLEEQGVVPDLADEITIFTQNKAEMFKDECTKFKFEVDYNLNFDLITKTIEKEYNNQKLNFYYKDDIQKMNYKIKNESDFIEILNALLKNRKTNNLSIKFFVEEAQSGVKYVITCVNCANKFELDEKEYNNIKDNNANLCEECKGLILNTVSNSLGTRNIPRFKSP